MSKGFQIAAGATLIALLMAWYAATNLAPGAAFTYYKSLDEFQNAADARAGKHSRVHGYVALGSIERDVAAMQVRFTVQGEPPHAQQGAPSALLPVVFGSLETPDLFKEGAEVVVEGQLVQTQDGGHFRADKVMAKCPSKFEGDPSADTRAASLN
ncbi:MAG: cytochrome c maturation protein CcmE [Myxococcales bacterium]|nr:cytochrome c maturation protein CcmE [Myxococcales bacterium]MDH5308151.1 cytochrome c maturation protein CcmE [Myxococcales bacterium]MDH5567897.1 cytochrome c maturation protein CcmE [Myxococcales bacterium]